MFLLRLQGLDDRPLQLLTGDQDRTHHLGEERTFESWNDEQGVGEEVPGENDRLLFR